MRLKFTTGILLLIFYINAGAQLSGTVFRDYNNNGVREASTVFNEPLQKGVMVNAFDSADVLIASYITTMGGTYPYVAPNFSIPATGTAFNGIKGSNTGFVSPGKSVRLEFVIPSADSCLLNNLIDFSARAGGTHVQFLKGGATNIIYGLNNPNEITLDGPPFSNTWIYQSVAAAGNPLVPGPAASADAFLKFRYNITNGTTLSSANKLANCSQIGTTYGVAYSKQADRIFVSAYLKRHCGMGPANGVEADAPGAIYIINPARSSTTVPRAASFFFSLDQLGYPTHNRSGTPVYGMGTSFNVGTSGSSETRIDTIKYINGGEDIIGTNSQRKLPASTTAQSNDAAAYGQVGKLGLGDLEISDDGQFLFVTNFYDRKIYQFRLDNPTNPTSVTLVNRWTVPNPPLRSTSGIADATTTYSGSMDNTDFYTGARGLQRPFGLKYYRGKMYIGAVTTGEGPLGRSTIDNNTGSPEYTDLWAYVWELDPAAGFNGVPKIQFPLNFDRKLDTNKIQESFRPWTNIFGQSAVANAYGGGYGYPQPMLSGIEFDTDGTMILAFRDRTGDQGATDQPMLKDTLTIDKRAVYSNGELLRAYLNPNTCLYELERNGKEGPSSSKPATAGMGNAQGPGGGEFYFQDGLEVFNGVATGGPIYHLNTALGSVAQIVGSRQVVGAFMDPSTVWAGGISWMNNDDGRNPKDYDFQTGSSMGKSNGLGDIEMMSSLAPIEIGNLVWYDYDFDGIQDANELGLPNVQVALLSASGTVIANATTDSKGQYYFSSGTGTNTSSAIYSLNILPNTNYIVRIIGTVTSPVSMIGAGLAATPYFAFANRIGNGVPDWSDSDGMLVGGIGGFFQASIRTGGYGENNHSVDFGFTDFRVVSLNWRYVISKQESGKVYVNWKIETDISIDKFIVEQSDDSRNFVQVTELPANGSNEYEAVDLRWVDKPVYYRVIAIKTDGTRYVSPVTKLLPATKHKNVIVNPNPAREQVKIIVPESMVWKSCTVSLMNSAGSAVLVTKISSAKPEETLFVGHIARGRYYLQIHNIESNETQAIPLLLK